MIAVEVWPEVLAMARERFPAAAVETWIAPLEPRGEEDGKLVLLGPRRVVWFASRRYATWLGETVRELSDLNGVRIREAV